MQMGMATRSMYRPMPCNLLFVTYYLDNAIFNNIIRMYSHILTITNLKLQEYVGMVMQKKYTNKDTIG